MGRCQSGHTSHARFTALLCCAARETPPDDLISVCACAVPRYQASQVPYRLCQAARASQRVPTSPPATPHCLRQGRVEDHQARMDCPACGLYFSVTVFPSSIDPSWRATPLGQGKMAVDGAQRSILALISMLDTHRIMEPCKLLSQSHPFSRSQCAHYSLSCLHLCWHSQHLPSQA